MVRDVDHEAGIRSRPRERVDAERESGADADADRGLPLEAAGGGKLAERRVAGHVGQLTIVLRQVRRLPVVVVRRAAYDDLQFRATAERDEEACAVGVDVLT